MEAEVRSEIALTITPLSFTIHRIRCRLSIHKIDIRPHANTAAQRVSTCEGANTERLRDCRRGSTAEEQRRPRSRRREQQPGRPCRCGKARSRCWWQWQQVCQWQPVRVNRPVSPSQGSESARIKHWQVVLLSSRPFARASAFKFPAGSGSHGVGLAAAAGSSAGRGRATE